MPYLAKFAFTVSMIMFVVGGGMALYAMFYG
ncbi:3-ketoacyl-(acyl-carrier-protein) reductase [Photobacterium sp. SKA34]|nr:3-ketoacyl-(acyl-carrier-protein) reductase [Photobacterium sp. SKA34]